MSEPVRSDGLHERRPDVVEAFVAEVRQAGADTWRRLAEVATPGPERSAAAQALVDAPVPASARARAAGASRGALRSLGLSSADFRSRLHLMRVSTAVDMAAMALVAGDALGERHREVLLRPFADVGFRSVVPALAGSGDG